MKRLQLLILIAASLFLPGCWDYHKINDRAMVLAYSAEPVEGNPKLIHFIFQVPSYGQTSNSGGESATPNILSIGYKNLTTQAPDVETAVSWVQTKFHKMMFFGNLQVVLMSNRLAKEQIQQIISESVRDPTLDKLAFVIFTTEPADKIMTFPQLGIPPADMLDRVLGQTLTQQGYTVRKRLWEFWRDNASVGVYPGCVIVQRNKNQLQVGGVQVFDGYNPKMSLTMRDTLFYNFVARNVYHLNMMVPYGEHFLALREVSSSSKIYTTMHNGTLVCHAKVNVNAELGSDESIGASEVDTQTIKQYEHQIQQYIQKNTEQVFAKLQTGGTDIYGFGRYWVIMHPGQQRFVKERWLTAFAQAKPDFQVKVHLKRRGTLK